MQRGADRDRSPDDSSFPAAVPAPPTGAAGEMEEEEEFDTTNMDRRERMIFKKYLANRAPGHVIVPAQKQIDSNRVPDYCIFVSGLSFLPAVLEVFWASKVPETNRL